MIFVMAGIKFGVSLGFALFTGMLVFSGLTVILSMVLGGNKNRRKTNEKARYDDRRTAEFDDDLK